MSGSNVADTQHTHGVWKTIRRRGNRKNETIPVVQNESMLGDKNSQDVPIRRDESCGLGKRHAGQGRRVSNTRR